MREAFGGKASGGRGVAWKRSGKNRVAEGVGRWDSYFSLP